MLLANQGRSGRILSYPVKSGQVKCRSGGGAAERWSAGAHAAAAREMCIRDSVQGEARQQEGARTAAEEPEVDGELIRLWFALLQANRFKKAR